MSCITMLFLALFILYIEFNLTSTNLLDKSHSNKLKFVSKVNQFFIQTNPEGCGNVKNTCSDILGLWNNGKILEPVISNFEEDLILLFKQLNNYYFKTIPNYKHVQDTYNKNINFIHSIKLQSDYVETICTYMPPCMNFIYLIYGNRPLLSSLYKNHFMLCKTLPNYLAEKCILDETNSETYNCENKTLYLLHKNITLREVDAIYMKKDYQKIGKKFISSVYTKIENIDIIPLIKKNPHLYENVFNNVRNHYRLYEINLTYQGIELIKNEKNNNLIQKMNEINATYIRDIKYNCDSSMTIPNNKTYITTKMLLTYTLKMLEKHFIFNVLTPNNKIFENKYILVVYEKDIRTLMAENIGKLCNFLPLILFFTNKNEEIDTTLFSMYFTFCGNYTNVFSAQCPNLNKDKKNKYYDKKCIIDAIKHKIQINFLSITGEVSKKDKYVNESMCTKSNFEYVRKVYEILSEHFKGTFIPLWTTYDWMSGKHFLINDYLSPGMKNLKLEAIEIEKVSITLPNIFTNILPWNSNKKSVATFQSVIFYKIKKTLDTYLYYAAQMISLYIERMKFILDDKLLLPLRSSVDWYKFALDVFYKNMCLRDNVETDETTAVIIYEIENLKNLCYIDKISEAVPLAVKAELKTWSDTELSSTNLDGYIKKLSKMAQNNCNDALDFLDDLISILIKSNIMQTNENIETLISYKTKCASIMEK